MAPRKKSRRRYHKDTARNASRLLAHIKQYLGHVISFTREDLLHLPVIEYTQVATITRYQAIRNAVRYLIDQRELVQMKFPDLCLPDKVSLYQFEGGSVVTEYGATMRRLIQSVQPAKPFTVMSVVNQWRTDQRLTPDTKRKAIRLFLPRLTREGVCTRLNDFEFMIGART